MNKNNNTESTSTFDYVECQLLKQQTFLLKFAKTLTKDLELAMDLLQDTNLRVLSNKHQYTIGGNFRGWIGTVMSSIFYNTHRRNINSPVAFAAEYDDNVCESNLYDPLQDLYIKDLEEVKENLPIEIAKVLNIRAEGYSYREIEQLAGVKLGTVKSRIHIGRQAILDEIPEYRSLTW